MTMKIRDFSVKGMLVTGPFIAIHYVIWNMLWNVLTTWNYSLIVTINLVQLIAIWVCIGFTAMYAITQAKLNRDSQKEIDKVQDILNKVEI